MVRLKLLVLSGARAAAFHGPLALAQDATQAAPEIGIGYNAKNGWTAKKFMVSSANPLATEAGYQILRQGGAAIDAAIATQLVLTLVEPQSSGIGGGAFLIHYDGKKVQAFDGR